MAEAVSLEGPVEFVEGELAILIPLDVGGLDVGSGPIVVRLLREA